MSDKTTEILEILRDANSIERSEKRVAIHCECKHDAKFLHEWILSILRVLDKREAAG